MTHQCGISAIIQTSLLGRKSCIIPTAKKGNRTLQICPSKLTYVKVINTRKRGLNLAYILHSFHKKCTHLPFLFSGGKVSIHPPQIFSQKRCLNICFLFQWGNFECWSMNIDNFDNWLHNKNGNIKRENSRIKNLWIYLPASSKQTKKTFVFIVSLDLPCFTVTLLFLCNPRTWHI